MTELEKLHAEIKSWMEANGFDLMDEEEFCWDCDDEWAIAALRFIHRIYNATLVEEDTSETI